MGKFRKNQKTRIMVFGTFDVLHLGHVNFFKQARRLAKNPFLIVSVARDVNVRKIKQKKPFLKELKRAAAVKKCPWVDKVVLGNKRGYLGHIAAERPEIIALGYDQYAYTQYLEKKLEKRGIRAAVTRLKPFKPYVYKSSLIKKNVL